MRDTELYRQILGLESPWAVAKVNLDVKALSEQEMFFLHALCDYAAISIENAKAVEKIQELKERFELTVLMAEQNFNQAVRIADRGYVIVHGQIAFEGRNTDELNNNELVRKFYLGL